MQQQTVPAPYRRLVQMLACAFYTGECPPYEPPPPGVKAPLRKGTNVRLSLPCDELLACSEMLRADAAQGAAAVY